jgi:glycosyltransferase involved in cell wall biosynthesis
MTRALSRRRVDVDAQAGIGEQNPFGGLRIAVMHGADPEDPRSYSGSSSHLIAALRGVGVDVHPVSAALPTVLGRGLATATVARWIVTRSGVRGRPHQRMMLAPLAVESSRAQSRLGRRNAAARGPLDGAVIVAGSELGPFIGLPYVTYDDMTVRQAARFPEWLISRLPPGDLRARILLQERQFEGARAVCTNTWWARDSVVGDYGIAPDKVRVVGFGGRWRRCLGAVADGNPSASAPRFLYVSRDWARKGGEVLLHAFARVHAERPSAVLDVVGHHPPIRQPGVRAHGLLSLDDPTAQRHLDELFARATCFVMPSAVEPSGLSLVEAGSCGLPSIVASVGGAGEVIGGGGVIVEPADVRGLAAAMVRLCDLGLAARLGTLARRHVQQLTWELTARRILSALGWGRPIGELPRVTPNEAGVGSR